MNGVTIIEVIGKVSFALFVLGCLCCFISHCIAFFSIKSKSKLVRFIFPKKGEELFVSLRDTEQLLKPPYAKIAYTLFRIGIKFTFIGFAILLVILSYKFTRLV